MDTQGEPEASPRQPLRMTTTTNGAHIAVTTYNLYNSSCNVDHGGAPCPDPLTVIPDEPCHTTGRRFDSRIVRETLRAIGVLICSRCYRVVAMAPRQERNLRPKGTGWRARP